MSFSDRLQKFYKRKQVIKVRKDSKYLNTSTSRKISEWDY